ncbi:anhydro-N-acetylmuramic acid kinase [Nevskia ramosa]|uniref:anhydro-N-acetylmuramic acid kinase n=1 Tax=Nevskia ramosa TaxID=64002 RepID=UPI002354439E|nr:anhydro-N-acetylmuramic acid kinase [Nevskia ramosa]
MSGLYLGLMSGTSIDGIDAVIAEFEAGRLAKLHATHHHDYPPPLRARLIELSLDQPGISMRAFCTLDVDIGLSFAAAAREVISRSGIPVGAITAIGSHGQTLFHDGPRGLTLQLGDPNRIAAATGITTVADFRRIDLALGGQGAPLVPAFHHAMFADFRESRCVLNLGGIANITVLPGAGIDGVIGFDTGPANGLMDEWMRVCSGLAFDAEGAFAASGSADEELIAALLSDPYFARPAPKSTGRDYFRLDWVRSRYPRIDALRTEDVQASLAAVTARSVASAIKGAAPAVARLIVCGGGVANTLLLRLLGEALPGVVIESSSQHGLAPEWIEATAFAWLAMRRIEGKSGNLPAVTGASRLSPLGCVVLPPR